MSVDRHDYLMIGYKLPLDLKDKNGVELMQLMHEDDKFLSMYEGWAGERFTLVDGGIINDFLAFGEVLESSRGGNGFKYAEISMSSDDFIEVWIAAFDLFSNFDFKFETPQLIIFSHFS